MNKEILETKRKNIIKKRTTTVVIGFLLIVFIHWACGFYSHWYIVDIFIMILFYFLGILLSKQLTYEFRQGFKKLYVSSALNKIFDSVQYYPGVGLNKETLDNTNMINTADRYKSNDFYIAKYKGIIVTTADAAIYKREEYKDQDGNTQYRYIKLFLGRWITYEYNKPFKSNMWVGSRAFNGIKKLDSTYEAIELEDSEFNNMFDVYAQSAHEAFYILTPQVMAQIKELNNHIAGDILLLFVNNSLYVAIYNNKDSFEPDISKSINEEEIMASIYKDINEVTLFADKLNLDDELFKKGGKNE